jgi:hypothetical protein
MSLSKVLSAKQIDVLDDLTGYEPALRQGQISDKDGGDIALGSTIAALQAAVNGKYSSAGHTGTGSSQNIAHGLGVVPSLVLASVYNSDSIDTWTVVEGVHDATNLKFTVTSGVGYKVIALA